MLCTTCVRRTQGYNNCLLDHKGFCTRYRSVTADLIAEKTAKVKAHMVITLPMRQPVVRVDPFAFMRA
jgi:hypothetical protein